MVDGNAVVTLDGVDLPIIVLEGQSVTLSDTLHGQQWIETLWREEPNERVKIAQEVKPRLP